MANYNDFINAANAAGLIQRFSEQDLQTAQKSPEYGMSLLSLLQDGSKAQTTEQQLLAAEAANTLRKNYGVYSGADGNYASSAGSRIDSLASQIDGYKPFVYDNDDAYQKTLQEVAQQQPFSYDTANDPAWSAYKKNYLREGERASANVLAQISAATGGLPSSYAATAAQQAANYYAAQLSDMIPTLQQNAYTQYLNDVSQKLSALESLRSDRDMQYESWLDGYNMLLNSLENHRTQDATDYQRYLDSQAIGTGSTGTGGSTEMGGTGTDGNPGSNLTPVPQETVNDAKSQYPGGVITNQAYWELLVAIYGEDALRAAGLTRGNTSAVINNKAPVIQDPEPHRATPSSGIGILGQVASLR